MHEDRQALRTAFTALAAALALAAAQAAYAACGGISGDYPVYAGGGLDVKKDVTVNGNPVADGASGAGSIVEPDGARTTGAATLPDLDPPTFPANASSTDADQSDAPFVAGADVYYDEITIASGQSASFSGGGPFHVDRLEVQSGATLNLAAGVYFVDVLQLGAGAVVNVTSEDVVLHIGTQADLAKDVTVNAGGSVTGMQVMLHAGAQLDAAKGLVFTGIIYGPQAAGVNLAKDTVFRGAIATGGSVTIAKDVEWTLTPADQAAIDAVSTCTAAGPDHLSIAHDGSAVNCQAEPVTIAAHDAGDAVDATFTGVVSLSTSTGRGEWSNVSGAGVLTNAGGGAATYAFDAADAGQVTLALYDSFPETLNIDALSGSVGEIAAEDPDLVFAEAGFAFLADGAPSAVGTQIAAKPSGVAPGAQTLELQAVRTSTTTGACEAAIVGATAVEFAYECLDPGTCTANPLRLSGVPIASNPAGAVASYTALNLDFGDAADTTAPLDLAYDDAGRVRLHARYALPGGGGDLLAGSSNAFVVRPFGFDVDFADDRELNGTAGASYAADAAGSRFVKAGEDFDVTVTAVAWEAADDADADGVPDPGADLSANAPTPGFGQESAPATTSLAHVLVEPAGGVPGVLSGSLVASGFVAGAATATLRYGEVGIVDIGATHADYLASGAGVAGSAGNVGRFYPAVLEITDSAPAFRDGPDAGWSCGFTYLDQPFAFDADPVFTVTARNLAGAVTSNYGGDFWKLTMASYLTGRSYTDAAVAGATFDAPNIGTVALAGTADYDGRGTLTISGERFAYVRPPGPLAPFASAVDLRLAGVDLVDQDGVCHHPADASCNTNDATMNAPQDYLIAAIAGASLRFGRLVLANAAGSELMPLALPLAAQVFDGAGFVTHTDDACTDIGTGAIDLVNVAADPPQGTPTIAIAAGASTATIANQPLASGDAGLTFSAPLAGNTGYADARFDLSAATGADLEWLRFDWDGDGSHDDDPGARATFGIFTGPDVLVHIREPW